jgi:hypothetical protein
MADGLFSSEKPSDQTQPSSIKNSILDFLIQKLNPQLFPTSAKTLIETLQGNKEQITEKNFTPEELATLKSLIEITKNRGDVQYADYIDFMKKQQKEKGTIPASLTPSILSVLDPIGNLQNTLGRFTYSRDALGNLIVVDNYDFNKQRPSTDAVIGAIRNYAGEKIPAGSGRGVRINLGNIGNQTNQPIQYKDPFADTTR